MKVTLKLATSLDGKIATGSGESRWITGDRAREAVHRLRAQHAGVLVGVETVIADDPELTVRLDDFVGRQPWRVIMDSRQRTPLSSKLIRQAGRIPTFVLTTQVSNERLTAAGAKVIQIAEREGRVDPTAAMEALSAMNEFRSLMVEGGGQVAASFIAAGLVDAVEWFRAPIVLGDEGRPAVGRFALDSLKAAPRFRRTSVEAVGDDLWERYERV